MNCGWDNADGSYTCQKCGQPLGQHSGYRATDYPRVNAPKPTVIVPAEGSPSQSNSRATAVLPPQNAEGRETKVQQVVRCSACGYPTLAEMGNCPNCGTPLPKTDTVASNGGTLRKTPSARTAPQDVVLGTTCQQCGKPVEGGFTFCPSCGARVHRMTIRHHVERTAEPQPCCSLTLVPDEGEQIEPSELLFEGKTIVLNRENTEPGNRTITSAQQAELTCEDGHWHIVDKSALQSTFLRPVRPVELQDGDVIMLGDRLFRFGIR